MKKMKKIIYIVFLLPFFGCSDFLDEVDQDKLVPEKVEHFSALLLKEFNAEYPIFRSVDYMTDNMTEDPYALTSSKREFKTTYTWQREIELTEEGTELTSINDSWQKMYEDIAVANYTINLVDGASGLETEKEFVKGEAHFVRALSYFNLLNLYGQPYDPSTANTELGVPLRSDIGLETAYDRNTVAECYQFIEEDLLKAMELMAKSGIKKAIWHPSISSCNLLMSRVKLYQQKWDEVIVYTSKVINDNSSLPAMLVGQPFVTAENKEILFSYYTKGALMQVYSSTGALNAFTYRVNKNFINLYDAKDKRKTVFFQGIDDGTGASYYLPLKYQINSYTKLGYANLRVSEAYLNRAEAYAKKNDVANAMIDLKKIHQSRYTDVSGIVYPTEPAAALAFVLTERRKELCFEDHHRWFDLRRMSNRPEIQHVFTLIGADGTKIGTEVYTLLSNDLNYTLPIPLKERQNNPFIRNNDRYEKIPQINGAIIVN